MVNTNIFESGNFSRADGGIYHDRPEMTGADIAEAVLYVLSTPYSVNVTELKIKPVGERFE